MIFQPKFPCLFAILAATALASCTAPLSYRRVEVPIPGGDFSRAPHSEALGQLKSVRPGQDPRVAAGRFFEAARATHDKALAGDEGAVALYNHAVARLVETLEEEQSLPWGTQLKLGGEDPPRLLRGRLEPAAPSGQRRFVVLDTLKFSGRLAGTEAKRDGVGAPLVAILERREHHRGSVDAPQSYVALTAVLRFDGAHSATLELHDPLRSGRISISGRDPVLAANFSAPASLALVETGLSRLGLVRLLNPGRFSGTAALIRLQNYDPERIPVVMVHGLQDTPATWSPMYQQLLSDRELRDHYQFWVFCYPSGFPYPHSAALMRKELDEVRQAFPDHKDLVLVGHSMGGIISRLMVTDAGEQIWTKTFGRRPDEFVVPGKSRQLLQDAMVFNHRKEVGRVVFIAAPHRGALLASNWIGRTASRLIRLPSYLNDIRKDFASGLLADAAGIRLNFVPNSIATLSPDNRFVREVNNIPVVPGVPFHSIIGDRGRGDGADSSDGVVAYWSSHMEGAASEKIVPSNHRAHQNIEAIQEVKRILRLHLRESR